MEHLAKTGVALALMLGATLPAQGAKMSFECPESIDETTPAKRAEIQKLLPVGNAMDDPGRLNSSIDALRRLGLSRTLIIDHLIGAYCPTVARDNSLSDADRTAKVRRFASRLTVLVYDVEEASLNVPLKPSMVDEVTARARKAGLSVEDWLSRMVASALQQP
ncbi:hypothetical protein [Bradyrhizobium japonicum]|uniref:hypothetical protein n=1 Tax=Bradyrhizobium japonicum TaxID=375 RepID=UPI0035143155